VPLALRWSADELPADLAAVDAVDGLILAVGRDSEGLAAWTSDDGVDWKRHAVPDPTFIAELAKTFGPDIYDGTRMGSITQLGDTIFSIGTFFGFNDFYRPVGWRSPDGKSWEFIESQSAFYDSGTVTDVEAFGDGLVAARATGLIGPSYSLWTWSPDKSWRETTIRSADKAVLVRLDAAVVGNEVVVLGQVAQTDHLPILGENGVAWTSTDGEHWQALDLPPGMTSACGVAAAPDGGFAVLGIRLNHDAAVWTTDDGTTWSRFNLGSAVCVDPEPLMLAGDWLVASVFTGDPGAKVWLSDDGKRWVQQDIPDIKSVAAAELNGDLYIIGTPTTNQPFTSVVLHGSP
jgi:hypothetical protein